MKITRFTFNMFGENCYVAWSPETRECMIVDPGMLTPAENAAIDGYIAREGLTVRYVVNTHLHLDHSFGNNHIAAKYGVATLAHPADHPLGRSMCTQAALFGISDPAISDLESLTPLEPGTVLTLGDDEIKVIHVPGHSPGGIALYAPADGVVFTGDSLFAGSIGRTDLPGGNHAQLVDAVSRNLLSLPPQTVVLPGHGPSTTVGEELRSNPFL